MPQSLQWRKFVEICRSELQKTKQCIVHQQEWQFPYNSSEQFHYKQTTAGKKCQSLYSWILPNFHKYWLILKLLYRWNSEAYYLLGFYSHLKGTATPPCEVRMMTTWVLAPPTGEDSVFGNVVHQVAPGENSPSEVLGQSLIRGFRENKVPHSWKSSTKYTRSIWSGRKDKVKLNSVIMDKSFIRWQGAQLGFGWIKQTPLDLRLILALRIQVSGSISMRLN